MNAVFYSEIFGTAQLVAEDVVGVKSAQPAEFLDMRGNAALAKGGSGDTLAGTIGGLLAQGIETGNAVRLGAYLFGLSAQYAARERSMSGILPSELPQLYPYILREFYGIA